MRAKDKELAKAIEAATATSLATPEGRTTLREALGSTDASLVTTAAKAIADHQLRGFEDELLAKYRTLVAGRASSDPACFAKECLLLALDVSEYPDAELFAKATQFEQIEGTKAGSRDTGGRVRARGLLGVARLGHRDLWLLLGARLADRDASVRLTAVRAIVHRGDRDGAGLLLLRAGVPTEEPGLVVESIAGAFSLAPDFAARELGATLRRATLPFRETLLHGLGSAPSDDAIGLLQEELGRAAVRRDRDAVIEAIGLSTRVSARNLLLGLVSADGDEDAEAAIRALSIHRYDERLVAQVKEAARNSRERLRLIEDAF